MWKTTSIESVQPLTEIMGELAARKPTGYGPWPYNTDTHNVSPVARVRYEYSETHHNIERLPNGCGWTRIYRLSALPRLADQCRKAGVDPDGVYLTIFDTSYVPTCWVKSDVDADLLRLAWAREHDLGSKAAAKSVDSTFIQPDQRAMYRAVIREQTG